jgi:predicted cation transporter
MLWQSLWPVPLIALVLAVSLVGFSVYHRAFGLNSKLISVVQENTLNVVLAVIIVVLGLLTVLISPILTLFVLGTIAFLLPINRREMTKFVMIGGLSIILGALTAVDLPVSAINFMRIEGALYPGTLLETLGLYTIFGIAIVGLFSLSFLKPRAVLEPKA